MRQYDEKIYLLVDNQTAVTVLQIGKSSSSAQFTSLFHILAKNMNAESEWASGHSGIRGNVEADKEARAALRDLPRRNTQSGYITLAYLRRLMQQRFQDLIQKWWFDACPARYQDLDLKMRRRKPPELALPQRFLHRLLATRTGYW